MTYIRVGFHADTRGLVFASAGGETGQRVNLADVVLVGPDLQLRKALGSKVTAPSAGSSNAVRHGGMAVSTLPGTKSKGRELDAVVGGELSSPFSAGRLSSGDREDAGQRRPNANE